MQKWIAALALAGCGDVGSPNLDGSVVHIDTPGGGPSDGAGSDGYSAFAFPGGLDRVVIVKTSTSLDICFSITLRSPANMPLPNLLLPMGWEVETAQALRPSPACKPGYTGPIFDGAESKTQEGKIEWPGSNLPPVIDKVDVTLLFDMPTPALPVSEQLFASNVPVM